MKKTVLLLAVFLALFAFVYFYEYKGGLKREEARETESSLLNIDGNDVESVALVRPGGDTLKYTRKDPDSWQIVSPVITSAENSSIGANINGFSDARIERRFRTARERLDGFGLDPPEAEVFILTLQGIRKHLLVGKETAERGDIFVSFPDDLDGDSTDIVVTRDAVRVQALKSLFDLRDKKIAHFDENQVNRAELTSEKGEIVLEKSGQSWDMKSPRDLPVDRSRVTSFLSSLKNYSAKAFVSEHRANGGLYGFDRPGVLVRLTLGDERTLKEIVVGKFDSEREGYYAYESGRDPVFLIRESTGKSLSKEPFYFEERKLATADKENVTEIRISGAHRWTLVPEDTLGWYAHGDTSVKVDLSRINRLFSDLRLVSVTDLVTYEPDDLRNYGLQSPFLEVVITSKNGGEEGFGIGNGFDNKRYAKRLGLPYVYSLPVSQVERITRWLEELK